VVSDIELPSLTTHLPVGEADLDFALKFDHVEPVPFNAVNLVDPDLLKQLAQLSSERIQNSEDFQKAIKNIARYEKQKDRKQVSLNKEKFIADRADMNADKEEEDKLNELNESKRPVVKKDYYTSRSVGADGRLPAAIEEQGRPGKLSRRLVRSES